MWPCRNFVAKSQGWDANLLSHSLEINHKTFFSLAFVFHLDKYSNVWMFIQNLSSDLPLQTTPLCTTDLATFLREGLQSLVSSHTHDSLLDIQQRVSLPPFKPSRPNCLTGSCVIIENPLGIMGHISPKVHFGLVGRVKETRMGNWHGQGQTPVFRTCSARVTRRLCEI